jgi:hypothetical protein
VSKDIAKSKNSDEKFTIIELFENFRELFCRGEAERKGETG